MSYLKRRVKFTDAFRIVHNKCKCSICLTVIESKHRHDFVSCTCGRIFTDGGLDYIHRGFTDPTDIIDLTEYANLGLDNGWV